MTLTKDDGQATATAGATLTYTLTYHNDGNTSATGVSLAETVPVGHDLHRLGLDVPRRQRRGQRLHAAPSASVAAGATSSVTFAVKVVDPIPPGLTQISNTATITDDGSQNGDPTPGDNTATDVDSIPRRGPVADQDRRRPHARREPGRGLHDHGPQRRPGPGHQRQRHRRACPAR